MILPFKKAVVYKFSTKKNMKLGMALNGI